MSSTKRTNHFQMRLNSIRQISNSKWRKFTDSYSRLLLRFPWSILAVSSILAVGLTICFFLMMQIRPFDQNDFLIPDGPSMTNARYLQQIFGNDTGFRMHQQLTLYPGLDIIIKRKANANETNMLSTEIIDEIRRLNERIQSIRINHSIGYNYSSLCIKVNHACIIDGNYILTDQFRQGLSHLLPPKFGYYFDTSGANGVPAFMFGKNIQLINATQTQSDYQDEDEDEDEDQTIEATLERIISHVSVLRLRYSLNVSTAEMRQLAIQWEYDAYRYLIEEYHSELIDLFPSISTVLTETITKKAHAEGLYTCFMVLIFFVLFHLFLSVQGNAHTSLGYLPLCGILNIGLSTGATFGILSLFGIPIIEPMTLLVFILIIVDCIRVSIVCGEYHRIIKDHLKTIRDISSDIELDKILPSILESTHPYFLASTFIISIVYLLLSFISPMMSTKLISLTLILYILINYFLHATFFSASLVITLKRVSSHRHFLCCYRLPLDYSSRSNEKSSRLKSWKNSLRFLSNEDSIWKRFFAGMGCLLLILFAISSIWICLSIDTRLFDDQFLPNDATSLRKYMQSQTDDFDIGPVVMFTIPEAINYENEQVKSAMRSLLDQCQKEKRINSFQLFWLDHENIPSILQGKEDLQLRITPFSQNDLIVEQRLNDSIIKASRFYCQYRSIKGDREDIRTMNNLYTSASQSLIPYVFPYTVLFPAYESLEEIRVEIFLLIVLFLTSAFIVLLLALISIRNSLLIVLHLLGLLTGTFTCLYLFDHLTFNFANALWLYIIPVPFLDILIHQAFRNNLKKWNYNRMIISLMMSLTILFVFPIQSYVFRIIRNSLIYQSILCLLLINVIVPSWNYFFQARKAKEQIDQVMKPTISSIEVNQALTNTLEINSQI